MRLVGLVGGHLVSLAHGRSRHVVQGRRVRAGRNGDGHAREGVYATTGSSCFRHVLPSLQPFTRARCSFGRPCTHSPCIQVLIPPERGLASSANDQAVTFNGRLRAAQAGVQSSQGVVRRTRRALTEAVDAVSRGELDARARASGFEVSNALLRINVAAMVASVELDRARAALEPSDQSVKVRA